MRRGIRSARSRPYRRTPPRRSLRRVTTIVFLVLASLAVWGAVETLLRLENDGYGRPEIRDRTRHVEKLDRLG